MKCALKLTFVVLFLLIISFGFYVPQVKAQTEWPVISYIWNDLLDVWARTSCLLSISIPGGATLTSSTTCSNNTDTSTLSLIPPDNDKYEDGQVVYYHDSDPDGGGVYGKLKGRGWSTIYGAITFNIGEFPADSCFGLTGSDRQPRIVKIGSHIRGIGCAYVPVLKTYILLGSVEPSTIDNASPTRIPNVGLSDNVNNFTAELVTNLNGNNFYGYVGDAIGNDTYGFLTSGAYFVLKKNGNSTDSECTQYLNQIQSSGKGIVIGGIEINFSDINLSDNSGGTECFAAVNTGDTLPTYTSGSNYSFTLSGDAEWTGIYVETGEASSGFNISGAESFSRSIIGPYLKLYNCGYSKYKYWAFGPNIDVVGSTLSGDGCLEDPTKYSNDSLGTSSIGEISESDPTINSAQSYARIGQEVTYTINCPAGYSAVYSLVVNTANVVASVINNIFKKIITEPIETVSLTCSDGRGFFTSTKTGSGSGIFVDTLSATSFAASPLVLTEGGYVTLSANVANFGNFLNNNGTCSIYKENDGSVVHTQTLPNVNNVITVQVPVINDSVYKLMCSFDKQDMTTITTPPIYSSIKILPNRTLERIIDTNLSAPALEVDTMGSNTTHKVKILSGESVSEVYVYGLSTGSSNRKINNTTLKYIISKQPSSNYETSLSSKVHQFTSTSTVLGFTYELSDAVVNSSDGSTIYILESRTNDGRRSHKVLYDANP